MLKKIFNKLKIKNSFYWLINKRNTYTSLSKEQYYERFGLKLKGSELIVVNRSLLTYAYTKAWENRNFEIDKFWIRAAYFWGFIVLIFGGYITVLTNRNAHEIITMHLDLYLLLLGLLFSIAWYLVIKGSKSWQENWEKHIDFLEDYISGPLYKTIYYKGRRYYSVSKLNEIMAMAVIVVWLILLLQILIKRYSIDINDRTDWIPTIAIFGTLICIIVMLFGYCGGQYKSNKSGFIDRWEKGKTNENN